MAVQHRAGPVREMVVAEVAAQIALNMPAQGNQALKVSL